MNSADSTSPTPSSLRNSNSSMWRRMSSSVNSAESRYCLSYINRKEHRNYLKGIQGKLTRRREE